MKPAQVHQAELATAQLPQAAPENFAPKEGQDFPLVIATTPAPAGQTKIATAIAILLIVAAAVIAPFARIQVAQVDAFIPVVQTVLSVLDLITAVFLFAQFSIQPQFALLALASGYISSGLFAFLQTLAFPGAYDPTGLIGDGFNTPAWLFVFWNITFPLAIIVYGLSKDRNGVATLPGRSTSNSIGITVACVLVAVAGLTWVVKTKPQYLPSLYTTSVTLQTRFAMLTDLALWLWGGTALTVLLAHRRTILDLWLIVTLLAWMPNFLLAFIANPLRFTIGWYAARCFVLIGSCMLLTVLLIETIFLYSRLTSAITLQRRERINRLLSVDAVTAAIAHELRTPLAAIALNASSAISEVHSNPPNLKELDEILKDIEAESQRAGAIISSIRELSKKTADQKTSARVEDVVRLVLRLLQHDLQISAVSVATQFQGDLPEVQIDGTQLQQVLLNLVKNAIDAMSAVVPEARCLRLTTSCDGQSIVSLSVQDSGPGIPVEDRGRLFDPFFTTKSDGMGLGLAICLTVIENHGGKLRLVKSDSDGSIFEIAIPVARRSLG